MSEYSRERVDAVLGEFRLTDATRLLRKDLDLTRNPMRFAPYPTRFCDGSFGTLYCAEKFETAVVEVVVRDRFVRRADRIIPVGEILLRSWLTISTPNEALRLVDLRGDGCIKLGAPTDAQNARSHTAGRALARSIHDEHEHVDGFAYESRLTGATCYAIFSRAYLKIDFVRSGDLPDHPQLEEVLNRYEIRLSTS